MLKPTMPSGYAYPTNMIFLIRTMVDVTWAMMKLRRAEERGQANYGWLDTHYTFSFANYYDPEHMGFRALRVINDDIVGPGGGFDTHGHRDMEIITYVLSGALQHKDSMNNGRLIRPGEFQYMAAGTGVMHSEFNPSPTEPVHLLQIWIVPDQKGLKPQYAERTGVDLPVGRLNLVASKEGRDGSMKINQNSELYLAKLSAGQEVAHVLRPQRHAWVHVAEGAVTLNGQKLRVGDGAAISEEKDLKLAAKDASQVLLFDLN